MAKIAAIGSKLARQAVKNFKKNYIPYNDKRLYRNVTISQFRADIEHIYIKSGKKLKPFTGKTDGMSKHSFSKFVNGELVAEFQYNPRNHQVFLIKTTTGNFYRKIIKKLGVEDCFKLSIGPRKRPKNINN